MSTLSTALAVGFCCLALAGCWGAPQWFDDEAQGRHVRDVKREMGIYTAEDVEAWNGYDPEEAAIRERWEEEQGHWRMRHRPSFEDTPRWWDRQKI